MDCFFTWPGPLARRHLSCLIGSLETLVSRLRESLARAVGEAVANLFHELTFLATGSAPIARAPSPSDWKDELYDDECYREADAQSATRRVLPSPWLRDLSVGCQTAGWWLARQAGRTPVLWATGLGVTAALLSYAGRPILGIGLAGVAGAVLHLLGLSEAVEAGAAAVVGR